jgi:hypothetical protein
MAGLCALVVLVLACATPMGAKSSEVPRMGKDELKAMLGKPELVLIDVRTQADWESSKAKIAGATREDPGHVDSWVGKYPKDKTLVLYCA